MQHMNQHEPFVICSHFGSPILCPISEREYFHNYLTPVQGLAMWHMLKHHLLLE